MTSLSKKNKRSSKEIEMAKKNTPPNKKKAAIKAANKAHGIVTYSQPTTVYGRNLTAKEEKAKAGIERAAKFGAKVKSTKITSAGVTDRSVVARKVDVDAAKQSTMKSSRKNYKATAMQMKSDRSRAATRAASKAKLTRLTKKK
jgi:hypothetical protein